MKTLEQWSKGLPAIPTRTAWLLADLAECKGRQELFTRQSPQKLRVLREHALIESAVASNRIEGVEVDPSRVEALVLGRVSLRDRNEEEVRGYRHALDLIHWQGAGLICDEALVRELHRLSRGSAPDGGKYRARDVDILETYPDGRTRVRFRTVPARQTPAAMRRLFRQWTALAERGDVPPLLLAGALNLDFLCIHPFRDGNGRVSRLLLLLGCYQAGLEVGRYISLERIIEENKERYYETLEASSQGWHEGRHDPWPYLQFVLFVQKEAYREFEQRLGQMAGPRGAKTEMIRQAIAGAPGAFSLTDLEHACPGVSRDMIRKILQQGQRDGIVECVGRGPGARWRKKG